MKYLCVFFIGMLLLWLTGCIYNQKIRLVRSIVLTYIFYIVLYVLVSAGLFAIDRFRVKYAVTGTALVSGICLLVSLYLGKKQKIFHKEWLSEKDSYLSFVLITVLVFFTFGSFGFFGMGQDQGVYQAQAINFYFDETKTYQNIQEYDELEDSEYKLFYEEQVFAQGGYNLLLTCHDTVPNVSETTGKAEGIWHGIPTYSAILALSAKILGLKNMAYVGHTFYICLLCLLEFVLLELGCSIWKRQLAILLLGISPQVIWIKESTLTEGFLAVLILLFIYYILYKDTEKRWLSVIPVTAFCFYHVTIYTVMPVLLLVYAYRYLLERDKRYLWFIRETALAYIIGFFFMLRSQPWYTFFNYQAGLKFFSFQEIKIIAVLGAVLGIIFSCILPYLNIGKRILDKGIKTLLCVMSLGLIAFVAIMAGSSCENWSQICSLTIICYSVLTGVFILPYIIGTLVLKRYDMNTELGILGLLFLWCIEIYCILMRRNISYYYYFSRYLMPFLAIIIIFFAILANTKKIYYCLTIVGLIILTPFTYVIISQKDDTHIQWDMFASVLENADSADAVFIDPEFMLTFYFPVRAKTGAKVYPVYHTLEETFQYVNVKGDAVYIGGNVGGKMNKWLSVKYNDTAERILDDNINHRNLILNLPELMFTEKYPVTVYNINRPTENIFAHNSNFLFGWGAIDDTGYRWMNAPEAYLECFLHKSDYQMIMHTGHAIPFGSITSSEIRTEIFLNDNYINTVEWKEGDADTDRTLEIPREYVLEGQNVISFKSNLWSPSEYGGGDTSTYSFSIDSIELKKAGE